MFSSQKNNLENHIENMHKVKRSSEHIEQLDGHIEVSVPSANSAFKDGFKNPNKPIEDNNDSSHAPKVITQTKDGPEIEMIHNRIKEIDPKMLETLCEKELSDLNAKIFRSVTCEMQLKRKPPCDISYLKLAVSKIIKKHMKA